MDKIENGVAALAGDDGTLVYVKTDAFGFDIQCRDILLYDKNTGTYTPDPQEKSKREKEYRLRLRRLFKR